MKKALARLLVLCMVLSMLAVPAMAADITGLAWSNNSYTMTGDLTLDSGTISSGTYTINTGVYKLTVSAGTIGSGASLQVNLGGGSVYTTSADASKITVSTVSGYVRNPSSGWDVSGETYSVGSSVAPHVGGSGGSGGGAVVTTPTTPTTTTTTNTDGSTTTTVTATDGSKTATTTATDGSTGVVKTDASGNTTSAEATVSTAAVTTAAANDEPVTLAVEVTAAASATTAAEVKINVPASVSSSNTLEVEIPVANVKATTVVVLVKADGTEEIIKDAALTEDGLVIGVEGDVTVKIVDNAKTFSDSAAVSSWASESVDFVTSREIFNGTDSGFEPQTPMNRGMFAQVLYNLEGKPAASNGAFADASGKWYDAAASWASANGVVNGDNGNFNGDANISRQDLVTMLYRYAQAKGYDTTAPSTSALSGFNDTASVAGYAQTAMEWAVANGIMGGMDGGINPTGSATREMVAAFAARFCNNIIH